MRVFLSTLCLNEMEWLPRLYEQHKDWPDLVHWVFVESADIAYVRANPSLVSPKGLSVDGTSEFLRQLSKSDDRVTYIPYGLSRHTNLSQGKCAARQRTVEVAHQVRPDVFMVLDADEFYTKDHQAQINALAAKYFRGVYTALCFKQVSPWHPPSIAHEPLFKYQVVGGFWSMPHCHFWKYNPSMRYSANHNHPCNAAGVDLCRVMKRLSRMPNTPVFVHMACAGDVNLRHAKNNYYRERGEDRDNKRKWYVESRAAFETWKPGDQLPEGATVVPYDQVIPEVFQ